MHFPLDSKSTSFTKQHTGCPLRAQPYGREFTLDAYSRLHTRHVRAHMHTHSVVCSLNNAVIESPCYHLCCTALQYRVSLKKRKNNAALFLFIPLPPQKKHTQTLKYTLTEATTTPRYLI